MIRLVVKRLARNTEGRVTLLVAHQADEDVFLASLPRDTVQIVLHGGGPVGWLDGCGAGSVVELSLSALADALRSG